MPVSREEIDVLIRLLEAAKYISDSEKAAKATGNVGKETKKAGVEAKVSAKSLALWTAGLLALRKGAHFIQDMIGDVIGLAKATRGLQRVSGLDARAGSAWVAVAKERGIQANTLQVAFTTLGRQLNTAATGSKTTVAMFKRLGISRKDIADRNTTKILNEVADAFERMPQGTKRAALAQKLFGRQGRALIPLLQHGRKGIREWTTEAFRNGQTLRENQVNNAIRAARAQRELKAAFEGLKTQLAVELLPALAEAGEKLTAFWKKHGKAVLAGIRQFGRLVGNIMKKAIWMFTAFVKNKNVQMFAKFISEIVKQGIEDLTVAFKWLWKQGPLVRYAIMGIVGAVIALNIALSVNPFLLLIIGIVLAIGLIHKAWDRFKLFRDVVHSVWDWIKRFVDWVKSNWRTIAKVMFPTLYLLVTHLDEVKAALKTAWEWVKKVVHWIGVVIDAVTAAPGKISAAASGMFDGIKNAFKSALNWIIDKWNSLNFHYGGKKIAGQTVIPGFSFGLPKMAKLAAGGIAPGGLTLVGERGPELVRLPAGTYVTPSSPRTERLASGRSQTIVTKVYLGKRQIAEAVAATSADAAARQ